MNKVIVLLIFWTFPVSILYGQPNSCRTTYLNFVLESMNYGQYYLVLKVSDGQQEREAVVINLKLYKYLSGKSKKLKSITSYRDFVKEKIVRGEALVINAKACSEMDLSFVKPDSSVIDIAQKGRGYFFEQYFIVRGNEAVLKHGVASEKGESNQKGFIWMELSNRYNRIGARC